LACHLSCGVKEGQLSVIEDRPQKSQSNEARTVALDPVLGENTRLNFSVTFFHLAAACMHGCMMVIMPPLTHLLGPTPIDKQTSIASLAYCTVHDKREES